MSFQLKETGKKNVLLRALDLLPKPTQIARRRNFTLLPDDPAQVMDATAKQAEAMRLQIGQTPAKKFTVLEKIQAKRRIVNVPAPNIKNAMQIELEPGKKIKSPIVLIDPGRETRKLDLMQLKSSITRSLDDFVLRVGTRRMVANASANVQPLNEIAIVGADGEAKILDLSPLNLTHDMRQTILANRTIKSRTMPSLDDVYQAARAEINKKG